MFDGAAFGKEMVDIVKGYFERSVGPLLSRLDALEKREPIKGLDGADGKDGVDGKDADPAVTAQRISDEVANAIAAMPVAQDGKSVTVEDVRPLIEQLVSAAISDAVKALPVPKDGTDGASVTLDDVAPLIGDAVAKAVSAIPVPENGKDGRDGVDGKDGTSISVDDVAPVVLAEVTRAVGAIPKAQDGSHGRDGVDGRDGRDGLDAVEPIIKDGVLLFTMSNGSVKEIGRVVGGHGSDGADGKDGADGLGFDDMVAEHDGERGIVLRFVRGEQVKQFAFSLPVVIDRGVWVEGKEYAAGDAVTWAGSVWIAQKDTSDKPDGGDGWRLSVKRGRDGKDGVVRDLTPKPVKVT